VNRGLLIAFEGVDGCGKSTQLQRLAKRLRQAGCELTTTGEPTGGPTGQKIREMARSGEALDPNEELRWFVEDRRVHVAETIEPALRAGRLVLTDRYYLSTVAYQGARGLDYEAIHRDSEAEFPIPDLIVLLEMEPRRALERVHARGEAIEGVFEQREFLEHAAAVFRAIDRPYLERVAAEGTPDAIERAIADQVRSRLKLG
jgi:dTMP kinase